MLALITIAFGRDMATATVISLEPFIKGAPDSEPSRVGTGQEQGAPSVAVQAQAKAQVQASVVIGKKSASLPNTGVEGKAARDGGGKRSRISRCLSFVSMAAKGGRKWRRRRSSLVFPVASDLTAEDEEAQERQETIRTAARLGIAASSLNKRQRAMLVAKVCSFVLRSSVGRGGGMSFRQKMTGSLAIPSFHVHLYRRFWLNNQRQ